MQFDRFDICAMREARRSTADPKDLQVWDGTRYVPASSLNAYRVHFSTRCYACVSASHVFDAVCLALAVRLFGCPLGVVTSVELMP